jgi:hypothetical protein
VSVTRLIDAFGDAGVALDGARPDRRERVERVVIPIWQWLRSVPDRASEAAVEWETVDEAFEADQEREVTSILSELIAGIGGLSDRSLDEVIARLRRALAETVERAEVRLTEAGIESRATATILLPVRAELASWRQQQETETYLSQTRSALTEVGARDLALSFNEQFEEDRSQANRFRWAAVGAFVGALIWSTIVYATIPSNVSAAGIVGRGSIAISALVVGGYFVRESAKHRVDANVWRTVQLQLDAIDKYSSVLTPESAEILRLALGIAVFSGPRLYAIAAGRGDDQAVARGEGPEATADLRVALDTLREVVGILVDARKGVQAVGPR